MELYTKLNNLDNIEDGDTRKLVTYTAGDNITIDENNVISATGGGGTGQGVPSGGTAGQVLVKKTDADYDTEWSDINKNDIFYQPGDTLEVNNKNVNVSGFVTGSTKILYFAIVTPKRLDNVTSVTIDTLKANTRISGGGYLDGGAFVNGGKDYLSAYTCSASISSENYIEFVVQKSSAYTSTTNNIPVAVSIANLKLTFS